MASDSERLAQDTVVVDADEHAARDEAWPVSEFYRVEPELEADLDRASDETLVMAPAAGPDAPRRRPPNVALASLGLVLALAAAVLAAVLLASPDDGTSLRASGKATPGNTPTTGTQSTATTPSDLLPDLEGMTVGHARAILKELGLRADIRETPSSRPRGIVVRQEPDEGTATTRDALVTLVVSSGPAAETVTAIEVPSVIGRAASDAVAALRRAGFDAEIHLVSTTDRAGVVVRQTPAAGVTAKRGSSIRLDVSKPRTVAPRIAVPDLVGMSATDARRRLADLGLTVEVVRAPSSEPVGTVIHQSPRNGARLAESSRVTLTVSTGPERIDVADVTGLDEESARTELETAGFEVRVIHEPTSDPAEAGAVLRQTPAGGTPAPPGSVVTIVVAQLS